MTNVLNAIVSNKVPESINNGNTPSFTYNTYNSEGKIRPLDYKGKLLPSKIFGSPVEYAKDLKQDVLNIGKAVKGRANDHELGRINDLAMKMGSLGLAAYLFVKNPLKLSKAMEFAGFGTFFASMALWPKLAIQLPLKLRTGVDIHQKYIDSQGRKKMLHQDPQYDLTDLYTREDLDRMGEKLHVNENLPDRDNFIKQRAKKTAVQGNTMWMLTSGFATPILSALMCNRLEKPIGKAIECYENISSSIAMKKDTQSGFIARLKQKLADKSLEKFIQSNSDKIMDEKLIHELSERLSKNVNSASFQDAVAEELKLLKNNIAFDENFVKEAVRGKIPQDLFTSLTDKQKTLLDKAIKEGSTRSISDILANAASSSKHEQMNLRKSLYDLLERAKKTQETPKLSQVTDNVKALYSSVARFAAEKSVLDRFIDARIGDKSGTYIANQWNRVGETLIKSLHLNSKELKALSQGNMDVMREKLIQLAVDENLYNKAMSDLMKLIYEYEQKTGSEKFTSIIGSKAKEICTRASQNMRENGFEKIADKVSSSSIKGTIENTINVNAAERVSGAKSSFYRLIQALDMFKIIKDNNFTAKIQSALSDNGLDSQNHERIEYLTKQLEKIVMSATSTDYTEKFKTAGFKLTEKEYKILMGILCEPTEKNITRNMNSYINEEEFCKGLNAYKDEFMSKVANWQNNMTKELSRRTVTGATNGANAVERNNLVGKPIASMIQDIAKQTYNSQKWLKIFGGAMAVLTAVTLTAGLFMGRKSKIEKQVEKESIKNG